MPRDPSDSFTDGAIERFITSAIATIITLIFSWQIIMDMEHHAANRKRRLPEGKGQEDAPPQDDHRDEKQAKNMASYTNGFGDSAKLSAEKATSKETFEDKFNSPDNSFDAGHFERQSLSDGETDFLKAVQRNDEFTFDEEISLIPAQLPLIQITPPGDRFKRPLEPYQTYFGSDSDSDVEFDQFDSNKLGPEDFYEDYSDDSSPNVSDSEIFCRHMLEAISEGDEEEYETSSSSSSEEEDHAQGEDDMMSPGVDSDDEGGVSCRQGNYGAEFNQNSSEQTNKFRLPVIDKHNEYEKTHGRIEPSNIARNDSINNSIKPEINCHAPRVDVENDFIGSKIRKIHNSDGIPLETDPDKGVTAFTVMDTYSPRGENLSDNCVFRDHSNVSTENDSDSEMSSTFDRGVKMERPNHLFESRGGDVKNESGPSKPASHIGSGSDTEVFYGTPGGSSDNTNIKVSISPSANTRCTSPVHVERLKQCDDSQGLNTIHPSQSSCEHTGIISRNYYLDSKKPSMNGKGDARESGTPPFVSSSPRSAHVQRSVSDVYIDSKLSDGTQDVPRGFTFVRCTEVEEDYKVTSTLLFQPRDEGVRLNVFGNEKEGSEEQHTPRVIEVDVLDIGGITGDRLKARAEILGETEDNVWDDLGHFDEITSKESAQVSAPADIDLDRFEGIEPVILGSPTALRHSCDNSDNDSSSTTTGDTAIEVIKPELQVVRIGSVDSNGTDDDFVGDILDEDTNMDKINLPNPNDVNEEEPVFVNLADTVHSPRFKTRRKFAPRENPGQHGNLGQAARIVRPHIDNSHTEIKNAYNKTQNTPGLGSLRILPADRDKDNCPSSGEESGTDSDSSGSFDCGGSPRGATGVTKPPLEALGEIEEEISSESSGEESVKRTSDTSNTSSPSSSSDSEYEDTEDAKHEHKQTVKNISSVHDPFGSGTGNVNIPALQQPCSSESILQEDLLKPGYIDNVCREHSPLEVRPGLHQDTVPLEPYETVSSPLHSKASHKHYETSLTPDVEEIATPGTTAEDMYSSNKDSIRKYSAGSDELIAYAKRPSYGVRDYVSPLAAYNSEPKKPVYTETGVQTLRSYRQPTACTFSPERYFRPSVVDSTTFSIMTHHHGTDEVEEHEFSEKGVQITFDPLWDRGESLVPSQDELSYMDSSPDECDLSSDKIDGGAFTNEPISECKESGFLHASAEAKNSSPSSISENERDFEDEELGERNFENDFSRDNVSHDLPISENRYPDLKAPKASLDEDFDFDIAPEVKVSPREEQKISPRGHRPRTPPLKSGTMQDASSISVDIDIDAGIEEPLVEAENGGAQMATPFSASLNLTYNDADDEGGSESETEGKKKNSMYELFSKPKVKEAQKPEKPQKPTNLKKPEIPKKKQEVMAEKVGITQKKPEAIMPEPEITKMPEVRTYSKPEPDSKEDKKPETREGTKAKDKEKKVYKSILQTPIDVEPRNISHLVNLPDKITKIDRSEIKEARQEYMQKSAEKEKTNEEERKALLSKLLGTRDWSDRPKPILKRPSKSFREIDDSRREALSKELSKSKESNVGVYNTDGVIDRISKAVERQKLEDKSKFQRTPLRATVGPIACSRYNEQMLKERQMSKSQTLPTGFGATPKEPSRSIDNILGASKSSSLPRAFSVVLVRSPSMTLHKTASSFFSDRKSYTNLLETDIDTGEQTEMPLVMETDLDEVLRIRKCSMPPKSRSLQDLYSQAGFKSVVKDIYDDTKEPKKWEKTQSLTALTNLSVSVYNDNEGNDEVFVDEDDTKSTRPKSTSEHEIRISKSLTKLDLPDWYLKNPPKLPEPKSPKPSKVPKFSIGDSEIANRSRTSSGNSSFTSPHRPVVIQTRVTMPRSPVNTSPGTQSDKPDFELPSRRIRKQERSGAYRPIKSQMESLDAIMSKSREALVEKELKLAERKRVTAEFQAKKWEPPVIKSPELKRVSPVVKIEPDTEEYQRMDSDKQEAIDVLADMLIADSAPTSYSSPAFDKRFTASASIQLNSAIPPPIPTTHNTSSELELSFTNSRQVMSNPDNPRSHFKPVNSSNSDPDSSISSINPPNFDRALARSSPDLTRESPIHASPFIPIEAPKPSLNLSSPPEEIKSISDIEASTQDEPKNAFRVPAVPVPVSHPKVYAKVKPPAETLDLTLSSKPPPPLRTSSRREAERPSTLPLKQNESAMERLRPQKPAPGRPEVPASSQQGIVRPTIPPPTTPKPINPIYYQSNTSRSSENDSSFTQERSPSYQAPVSVTLRKSPGNESAVKPVGTNQVPKKKTPTSPPTAPKPSITKKPKKAKTPESPKKIVPEVAKKPKPAPPVRQDSRRKPEPVRAMPMSHPVNTSTESQETPSFRLARAPGSRSNSFRDSAVDYNNPNSPVGFNQQDGQRSPVSSRANKIMSPIGQGKRPEVELRRQPNSPRTPDPPYKDIGHHPSWRPLPPEVLRRSYQFPVQPAPQAVIETDSDLSLYSTPEPPSPKKAPYETDLDTVKIRRLPARVILETDIDSDTFESPLRKKGLHPPAVIETNIDDDISSRNSSYRESGSSRNSSYRVDDPGRASRNSSFRDNNTPTLPPKRYTGYQPQPVKDFGTVPVIPPRWDADRQTPMVPKDYGPAPGIPPRQTPVTPNKPIETDIDGDLSFNSSDGSQGTPRQHSSKPTLPQTYNSKQGRYYDNVPGSKDTPKSEANLGYNRNNRQHVPQQRYSQPLKENAQQKFNSQDHSKRQQQMPLYYQNHQQNNQYQVPPIPPRETIRDVPPPAIHKADGLFESDIDFNLNKFETVAVEGDANSITPHGTLTRFGRDQKQQQPRQQQRKNQSNLAYDFFFEPPSNSIPPTPVTSSATYTTCALDRSHQLTSSALYNDHVPMETEEDMLFAFIVNKQPKNDSMHDDQSMVRIHQEKPGNLEFGPDSFQALGKKSDLKVDTDLFRFTREEDKFRCEVGFSRTTDQEASLAEVLDGLLALPPSPQGGSPMQSSTDSLEGTLDSPSNSKNEVFGPISESGENLLAFNKCTQNIDENRVHVKCRSSRCGKEMVLVQARSCYKTCHNCYTYYCCRQCRRNDWPTHKVTCSYNRVSSMCKHIIKKVNKDPQLLYEMSKCARAGYLQSGRGCMLFVFQSLPEAEQFVRSGLSSIRLDPVYCSMTELEEFCVLGEYGDAVMDMCVDYSPYLNFIVSVAIVMSKDTRANSAAKREGPVIKKCAKLTLCASLSESETNSNTAETGSLILTLGGSGSYPYVTAHEARDESFDNVQRKLRQRGVCLREQYPDVFNQLVAYVNENQAFSPVTIYPYDGSTGSTFTCVIKLEQEVLPLDSPQITFNTFA